MTSHKKNYYIIFFAFISLTLLSMRSLNAVIDRLPAQSVIEGSNRFAFDFYNAVKKERGNFCFSPYSISEGLGMVLLASSGKTSNEIQSVIRYPALFIPFIHSINEFLIDNKKNRGPIFLMGNALWISKNILVHPLFKKEFQRNFNRPLHSFLYPQVVEQINQSVADTTRGAISQLITTQNIPSESKLILTTSAAFRGSWLYPFDTKRTKALPFKVNEKEEIRTSTMFLKENLSHYSSEEWDLIALPYLFDEKEGPQFELIILLPKEKYTLAEIEPHLKLAVWQEEFSKLKSQLIELFLPKFRLEGFFSLEHELKALNLNSIFIDGADFSEITETKIFLNYAVHKASFRVEEGFRISRNETEKKEEKAIQLKIDRPFIVFLLEKKRGAIVMMGKVEKP